MGPIPAQHYIIFSLALGQTLRKHAIPEFHPTVNSGNMITGDIWANWALARGRDSGHGWATRRKQGAVSFRPSSFPNQAD